MHPDGLDEVGPDADGRVESAHGALGHERNPPATDPVQVGKPHREQVPVFEQDPTGRASGRREQPEDGVAEGAFAGSGFSDQSYDLAPFEDKVDAAYGPDVSALRRVGDVQIVNLQQ